MRAWMLLLGALSLACSPIERDPSPLIALGSGATIPADAGPELTAADRYQLGSEWGKRPVDSFEALPTLERIAKGTGTVGGGTGFYLGSFAGQHVVATNHHVCPAGFNCLGGRFSLPLLAKQYRLASFLGTWDSVDLTLLTITVPPEDAALLATVANPFQFDLPLRPGQELITVGFGASQNPTRRLVANADSDCLVFSEENDFRLIADPDSVNPSDYLTWSFANGCDVSHGDSGSAMVDRESGGVVGLIWTGKVPKIPEVQDSAYLQDLLQAQGAAIWSELSYAVPAAKIREKFAVELASGRLKETPRAVIDAMIAP